MVRSQLKLSDSSSVTRIKSARWSSFFNMLLPFIILCGCCCCYCCCSNSCSYCWLTPEQPDGADLWSKLWLTFFLKLIHLRQNLDNKVEFEENWLLFRAIQMTIKIISPQKCWLKKKTQINIYWTSLWPKYFQIWPSCLFPNIVYLMNYYLLSHNFMTLQCNWRSGLTALSCTLQLT